MSRRRSFLLVLATLATLSAIGTGTASAAGTIVFSGAPGTGAPPATLGPFTMTPFAADPQPLNTTVGSVAAPSGDVTFSSPVYHTRIGIGWATWSHGYTGDVYWTFGATSITLTLPPKTSAFYLYAEPNPFSVFTISATAQDGTTSGPVAVDGFAGAQYFGFYGTEGKKIESITVSSAVDFAIGEFGIVGDKNYVALGDSYSSGEGVPPFDAGTDGGGNFCHRSPLAYSRVLGQLYGMTPKFYACSGAVTSNITSTFHNGEPPQITRDGVDDTADLVTITIGGNDAGFSDTLKACIGQKLKADVFNAAIGPVARWLGLGREPSCAKSSSFTSSVHQRIDNVFSPVLSTYQSLKSATGDETSIIAANYPHLFPTDHDDQDCLALEFILTNDTQDWMNSAGDRLDNLLASAASTAGINFADVRGTFAGHEICGPAGAYINGLSMASGSGGACTWEIFGRCIIPGIPLVGSFHPNAAGHANGYAPAFAAVIDSAANKNDAGFPVNPFFFRDLAVTAKPAIGIGTLTAEPVTDGSADCAGTYQAGQQVSVSGGGFVPGTSVEIYASSRGFGDVVERLVGTATADVDGRISETVRIPLSSTGFTPEDAAAGLVMLDAIGLGTAGDHWDDVAIIGLASHSSSCGTVEELPFEGFDSPIGNLPKINKSNAGRTVPVKFSTPGIEATLDAVLAAGYPQSAPVSCTSPESPTSGDPTEHTGKSSPNADERYHYNWKTDRSWNGCRALIVKLVDGSYHRAVFDFGS